MKQYMAQPEYVAVNSKPLRTMHYVVAALFVIMAVAQLFAFEDMGGVLAAQLGVSWQSITPALAATIVVLEVCAVVSVLPIAISPALRWVSRVASVVVWVVWYGIVLAGIRSNYDVNSGLLGDKIPLPAHASVLMAVLACGLFVFLVQYLTVAQQRRLSVASKNAKIRK